MTQISIIVLSSDGYSDCWIPFFTLLKKNFPEVEKHELILSTNSKKINLPNLEIRNLLHGNVSWSKRLKESLIHAKNEIVLVVVEDFFLRSKIDKRMLTDFLKIMENNKKVEHIRLLSTITRTKTVDSEFNFLDEIKQFSDLRFLYSPGLWKKKVLIKYVKDFESPFVSERIGDLRSWIFKDGFYAVSEDYIIKNGQFYNCAASGAIFKGKWAEWITPFLKKNNEINIDLKIRGFATDDYRKKTRRNSKIQILKEPVSTSRSLFSIIILFIKVKLLKLNK